MKTKATTSTKSRSYAHTPTELPQTSTATPGVHEAEPVEAGAILYFFNNFELMKKFSN